ncbi:MAG: Asp/Glu/hydantoin racemase [Castellaniella sp.]|uniref:aspartate/glutamate racemase family protein n=1 Tax=Castellaniella sp. TaxID=1955812 RepID=UPI0011FFD08B|nr:aspartate/glutamate racemase family protein [Castellaniella sp.]TAN29122.1 MAG: Asp/Glu/hydantoin racemase [Castellaniella sp.]
MRLLIINPNTSTSVSDLIDAEARRVAAPDTQITTLTAQLGVAYIETRFESLIAGYATALLAAEHASNHDAMIVAAFGDPGITGLREAMDIPVVGLTEAALMTASMLGQRFSIIAISSRITSWYRENVERNGLSSRLASIRNLQDPLRDIGTVQDDHAEKLVALCQEAVTHDHADVIILAGAPLAGLARRVKDRLPVPVVDGVSSAVCHAETLAKLAPTGAVEGSFARPPIKPNTGLPTALADLLARRS